MSQRLNAGFNAAPFPVSARYSFTSPDKSEWAAFPWSPPVRGVAHPASRAAPSGVNPRVTPSDGPQPCGPRGVGHPVQSLSAVRCSDARSAHINQLVEVIAESGVGMYDLDNALSKLFEELEHAGTPESDLEIIRSVNDRLHGWCHTSRAIYTKTP